MPLKGSDQQPLPALPTDLTAQKVGVPKSQFPRRKEPTIRCLTLRVGVCCNATLEIRRRQALLRIPPQNHHHHQSRHKQPVPAADIAHVGPICAHGAPIDWGLLFPCTALHCSLSPSKIQLLPFASQHSLLRPAAHQLFSAHLTLCAHC